MMKIPMERILVIFVTVACFQCRPADGNRTGTEYMPDMAHSIAYEPNVNNYYYYHSWGSELEIANYSAPKLPVQGTKARGSLGWTNGKPNNDLFNGKLGHNAIATPINGSVEYYYKNTEDERLRATKEISSNPLPISADGLSNGKLLYNIYCSSCHGEKGDGGGYLVRDDGGKYPAQPANFLKDEFIASSEGRFYHAIMYGRNVMGSHADKLSYEERWNVIHYIRSLQASSKKLIYSEKENTFTGSVAVKDAAKALVPAVTK
ncbi:MAG: cytochrome c [Saprospiraceae bacterium]|nr:cytochrome c [Saprospiraceae bacterium]